MENRRYLINEISKICHIPIRTLHYYHEIGLIIPREIDINTGYRYYAHDQIPEINTVRSFKKAGFSLKEIKILLRKDNLELCRDMMTKRAVSLNKEIQDLINVRDMMLFYKVDREVEIANSHSEIVIKKLPGQLVAFSRYRAPAAADEFYLRFSKLVKLIEENQWNITGPMLAVYHDHYQQFDGNCADIEVCAPVGSDSDGHPGLRYLGDEMAVICTHYGGYETMVNTYGDMMLWIEENGLKYTGPGMEKYIVDIIMTKEPKEYVTELILPVSLK